MDKKRFPAHTPLFAIYPALFLFSVNAKEIIPSDVIPAFAALLFFCGVLFLAFSALLKNRDKAAIVVSFLFLLFFSYSSLYETIIKVHILRLIFFRHMVLSIFLFLVFAALFLAVARAKSSMAAPALILNVIATALILMSSARLAASLARDTSWIKARNAELAAAGAKRPGRAASSPDIYYIIFDRYAGNRTLKDFFGFDNSEIVAFLEKKGFYFAKESVCNYTNTSRSLASSLNMSHLDFMEGDNRTSSFPANGESLMIRDNIALRKLRSAGYYYVYIGSPIWSTSTRADKLADKTYYTGLHKYLDEFSFMLFSLTPAYPFYFKSIMREEKYKQNIIRDNIGSLISASSIQTSPKFVMAHLMIPHPPFVFMRDGATLGDKELAKLGLKGAYLQQLMFTNTQIKKMVETLLNSPRKPIIILQSDEGPFPVDIGLTDSVFGKFKCPNLNALYLPGLTPAQKEKLYPSISPVNNFRMLFNLYFGDNYPMLPDTCRKLTPKDGKSYFVDYTHLLKKGSSGKTDKARRTKDFSIRVKEELI